MRNPLSDSITESLFFDEHEVARYLYGHRDEHLKVIETTLNVEIGNRGEELLIAGNPLDVQLTKLVLAQLYILAKKGHPLSRADISRAITILSERPETALSDIFASQIFASKGAKNITPKGINQKLYVDAIRHNDIVFGIGPAGTGKTYLAMAMALSAYFEKRVKRIILTRPAVEAGEKLGFLPGDLAEKVNPYLRPLYDALHDMVELDRVEKMLERGIIEVAPLAFMRGRTLNDAFIIFDEAQNATSPQLKMFLTRIGQNSKAIITGDITQIDLPSPKMSGLIEALDILQNIPGISINHFSDADVVRHPLVQKIIVAYESRGS